MSDEKERRKSEMPDAEELKEVLAVVSTEIPKLLESISNVIYKSENAETMGKSIALLGENLR